MTGHFRFDFKYISGRSWSCIRYNEIDKIRTWSKKYFEPWKGFVKYILNTDKLSLYTVFIILSIRSDIKSVFQTLQGFKTSSWLASFFRISFKFNVENLEIPQIQTIGSTWTAAELKVAIYDYHYKRSRFPASIYRLNSGSKNRQPT